MAANANTDIYDKSVDRAAMIRLYERGLISKLGSLLTDHEKRTQEIILSNKAKMSDKLREEIDKEISSSFSELHSVSSKSLLDLVKDQVSYAYQNLDNAISKIFKVQKPGRRIAEEIVLQKPLYNDITLAQGWLNLSLAEKKKLQATLRRGIAQGLNEKELALFLRRDNVHKISRNGSIGLARTAITSVYVQADHEIYRANKTALKGWQYVAVLDARTTPICAHRDGTIYPVDDFKHLPPAHWHCRSTTIPVVKEYSDFLKMENVSQIRKRNLEGLSEKEIAYYDGLSPAKESYNDWLMRQPKEIQLKHLGDSKKLQMFQEGQLTIDKFTEDGREIGINELKQSAESQYAVQGDTRKFAFAKQKLDTLKLGVSRPEELVESKELQKALEEYYLLQSGDLNGLLSYTNYRGALIHTKRSMRNRVLSTPPSEDNLKFNPLTNRYDDSRLYQPNPAVLNNNLKLVEKAENLKDIDKKFITDFINSLESKMSVNERAVVADNLRIVFTRFRKDNIPWNNFKAVLNNQMKFDVMNVSDYIETQLRKDANVLNKLTQMEFIDPVLGPVQLQELHDSFIQNIFEMRKWEYSQVPKIARKLRNVLDRKIPFKIKNRLEEPDLIDFYQKFARRLSMADTPDRDQFAVSLGRDLYNAANYRGSRNEWFNVGKKLLDDAKDKGFYELDTYGVQKRRMKSRNGNRYFGPYYDTFSVNIRIVNPSILEYAKLVRKVDVGMRIGVTTGKNRLKIREGFKTYFTQDNRDTGIPIVSVDSFQEFPTEMIDANMTKALNWAASSEFKVDKEYYDFIEKLLYFKDDKGKAQYFDNLNEFKKYIASRGDSYERFKNMKWLKESDKSFSNHPFLDHRGRIYDRGFIGPQSGETFRPFLNTAYSRKFSKEEFYNFQDQIGSFFGGLSDDFEGPYNSLSVLGRQKVSERLRPELVKIGYHMRRAKPDDIRNILESPVLAKIDGEEQAKALRFAIEAAKIDEYLGGDYSESNLVKLKDYDISLALEQDASSSGAQIIALTTRNKKLAELSNVVPTNQKQRLYDEIAAATYADPRFKQLNLKLGLTEKDLRKAAKSQNMVTFYGAGERTGILNVEGKLAKVLNKDEGKLVVSAAQRDQVLNEISARMARYETLDPELYQELKALRQDVKEIFNKGLSPGQEIMDQLYFLDSKTREFLDKMSMSYDAVVTPDDFALIAKIMSENLSNEVPILKDFTRFFGRLAEDFVTKAKPKEAVLDWKSIAKKSVLSDRKIGSRLHPQLAEILGINPNESITEKILKRFEWWKPNSTFADLMFGARQQEFRRTGFVVGKVEVAEIVKLSEFEVLYPNKMPKTWTQVPWVNFDGKIVEQKFTQTFEERLRYKDAEGNWITNIIQVKQKTDPTWWQEFIDKNNTINDIVDAQKARTAFAVNGNHSNDATLVKNFHIWGAENKVSTATVHDAFFTNAAELLKAKEALRKLYARSLDRNVIFETLEEMRKRGLPDELYDKYLQEAMDIGLIPVVGRSKVGGKILTEKDILTKDDILEKVPENFKSNRSWYGIGG